MAEPTLQFVVEDGTGLENANAFASLDFVLQHWVNTGRGSYDLDESINTESVKQKQAIVRASRWLSDSFDWSGYRKDNVQRNVAYFFQGLAWPRYWAIGWEGEGVDPDTVPEPVKQATAEAAWQEYQSPNSLTPTFIGTDVVKMERAGSVAVEYQSAGATARDIRPVLHTVLDLISHLLAAYGNNPLSGASVRV